MIDVNTQGVEAAAATSVSIVPKFGSFKVNFLFDKNMSYYFEILGLYTLDFII